MTARDWVDFVKDAHTGIETLRAHFEGHAYDPHWHESYLVGTTAQGVQQFRCRRAVHRSTPGRVFMLEPGEIHDGEAPTQEGFTYQTLYLDPRWLSDAIEPLVGRFAWGQDIGFTETLVADDRLAAATANAVAVLRDEPLRIVRHAALDDLLTALAHRTQWKPATRAEHALPAAARAVRDYLHDNLGEDVGLSDLVTVAGVDRFRLSRAFKQAYGLAPHAYLVQLRLTRARRMLAAGDVPATVAAALGFADQSHLGRWFRRAYGLTPAAYRRRSNLPD